MFAKTSLFECENLDLEKVICKRKERTLGKRVTLKSIILVSTKVVQKALEDAQEAMHQQQKRRLKKGRKRAQMAMDMSSKKEDEDEES